MGLSGDWYENGVGMSGTGRGMAREGVRLAGEGPGKERDWLGNGPGKSVTVRGMACKCHEIGRGLALPPRVADSLDESFDLGCTTSRVLIGIVPHNK